MPEIVENAGEKRKLSPGLSRNCRLRSGKLSPGLGKIVAWLIRELIFKELILKNFLKNRGIEEHTYLHKGTHLYYLFSLSKREIEDISLPQRGKWIRHWKNRKKKMKWTGFARLNRGKGRSEKEDRRKGIVRYIQKQIHSFFTRIRRMKKPKLRRLSPPNRVSLTHRHDGDREGSDDEKWDFQRKNWF